MPEKYAKSQISWQQLTKEYFETFWNTLKEIFVDSKSDTKGKGYLSLSQRQAGYHQVIRKNNRRFIQNWRNADLEIILKTPSEKLKNVLPDLISSQQTTKLKT